MATAVAVTKRVYFKKDSLTTDTWYYVELSGFGLANLTAEEVTKELKRRGYTNIETRYHTAAWP